MAAGSLAVYAIAARDSGVQVENPRQVSAYDYPRRYGPRSPSFARATVAAGLLLTAGTSSVVGHRSVHGGDVAAQLEETLANLEALALAGGGPGLAMFDRLKVYLRRRSDYELVAARLERELPGAQMLFLESDICRGDLLVEIEGVGRVGEETRQDDGSRRDSLTGETRGIS
jgi:chorismate lyase/3-hydroxybenzoate synthase